MKKLLYLFLFTFLLVSCGKDMDDEPNRPLNAKDFTKAQLIDLEVKDFVWKGLNSYYLWQANVPNLADNRFASSLERTILSNEKYLNFLNSYPNPNDLFNALKYEKDRFSWIVDDYETLERQFQGISQSTGMEFGLSRIGNTNDILGFVQYVLPNTSADKAGVKRGVIFTEVDGKKLTVSNFRELLFSQNTSYTINSMHIENHTLIPDTNITYTLTKEQVTENPVFIHKVIEKGGKKIGYLMYNSYTATFDLDLNNAFGEFKAQGIDELVLDLRYNGGGSISSAIYLSSMITGQFNGKLFAKNRWNNKLQKYIEEKGWADSFFTNIIDKKQAINSLNLSQLYVITTGATASASELTINGLRPYIKVTQIGTTTVGKNQGSITIKDMIGEEKVNPRHKWAMQPIVLKIENAKGFGDYEDGLEPNIEIKEDIANLGVLGDENEPLLAKALSTITGITERFAPREIILPDNSFTGSKSVQPLYQEMYLSGDFYPKK